MKQTCVDCGKQFGTVQQTCVDCGKQFGTVQLLMAHRRTHGGQKR